VLTYGPHFDLVHRCIESIRTHTDRAFYRLVVGANAVGPETDAYLRELDRTGAIDRIHRSRRNINKCPMMRRMFREVKTPFICWFDDDSYLTEPRTLERQLKLARRSSADTMMWGARAKCNHPCLFIDIPDVDKFVRTALWYRGLTPPSLRPGGRGEFNYQGTNHGNGWWEFLLGGFWLIRTRAIRALDWPDRRLKKLGDDVLLGEALRQQGWTIQHTAERGVAIDQAARRGDAGGLAPARLQRRPALSLSKGRRSRQVAAMTEEFR
jgi:GT2 family glycosyltransferase